jgi:hypothetical protein
MTASQIYRRNVDAIKELADERSCLVCDFHRTSECPSARRHSGRGFKIAACPKWNFSFNITAQEGRGEK